MWQWENSLFLDLILCLHWLGTACNRAVMQEHMHLGCASAWCQAAPKDGEGSSPNPWGGECGSRSLQAPIALHVALGAACEHSMGVQWRRSQKCSPTSRSNTSNVTATCCMPWPCHQQPPAQHCLCMHPRRSLHVQTEQEPKVPHSRSFVSKQISDQTKHGAQAEGWAGLAELTATVAVLSRAQ